MNKYIQVTYGLVVHFCLIHICIGSDVIAWGISEDGKPRFAAYALPTNNLHDALGPQKVCPVSNFAGLVLTSGSEVFLVGDVPAFLKPPDGLNNVVDIAAGREFGMALKTTGTVSVWGARQEYQGGYFTELTNITAIAAGGGDVMAINKDGTVAVWLFDNLTTQIPDQIRNVMAVSLSQGLLEKKWLILKQDGTVVEWYRHSGKTRPVAGLSNVMAVAASPVHSLALKQDGTVTAWGSNVSGETEVPKGLTNVVAIAAGGSYPGVGVGLGFSLALRGDGTLVGWGQLRGHANVVPAGLSNVVAIAASEDFCLALTTNSAIGEHFRTLSHRSKRISTER